MAEILMLHHRFDPDDEGNCWECGNEREHVDHRPAVTALENRS